MLVFLFFLSLALNSNINESFFTELPFSEDNRLKLVVRIFSPLIGVEHFGEERILSGELSLEILILDAIVSYLNPIDVPYRLIPRGIHFRTIKHVHLHKPIRAIKSPFRQKLVLHFSPKEIFLKEENSLFVDKNTFLNSSTQETAFVLKILFFEKDLCWAIEFVNVSLRISSDTSLDMWKVINLKFD